MKILVLGGTGLLGFAIEREIKSLGHEVIFAGKSTIDLTNRESTFRYFEKMIPDTVILAAAVVGGIYANKKNPIQFLSENIQIYVNAIDAASKFNVDKLLFISSSIIYPEISESPIQTNSILSGILNVDTQYFAVAKIAGVKLIEANKISGRKNWVTINLSNLFGLNDSTNYETSHVIPSLISKIYHAHLNNEDSILILGSPSTRREFLNSADAAKAILHILFNELFDHSIINVGSGVSTSIQELSELIAEIIGFKGEIEFEEKTSSSPEKILDSSYIISSGWKPKVTLESGLREIINSQLQIG